MTDTRKLTPSDPQEADQWAAFTAKTLNLINDRYTHSNMPAHSLLPLVAALLAQMAPDEDSLRVLSFMAQQMALDMFAHERDSQAEPET